MTIPRERTYALQKTRAFLYALTRRDLVKAVPAAVRQMASDCLRHYPGDIYLEEAALRCGDFDKPKEQDLDHEVETIARLIQLGPRYMKERKRRRRKKVTDAPA